MTAKTKRAEQANGIVYGCHVDGEVIPDCVLDSGDRHGCPFAGLRRIRETCEHWKPVIETPAQPGPR